MSVVSIRFKNAQVAERLRQAAGESRESISALAERLIDEGLRMADNAGILFRDGPTGRRAGLAAGPDVWEIVALLRGLQGPVEQRHHEAAERLGLAARQIAVASRYYVQFPDEVDTRMATNEETAERELALWEKEQSLLSG